MTSNRQYWTERSGDDYRRQQHLRRDANNESYSIQERWFLQQVSEWRTHQREGSLRLLDYGCGFGRFAYLLADLPDVEYYGFDISANMAAPLLERPPEALRGATGDRIRINEDFHAAFGLDERFDVIFTVSVLIHNQPAAAAAAVNAMLDRLAPDGRLVLIENMLTAVSSMENLWHGGCWAHCFPRYARQRADIDITDNFAGRHGVYVLTPHADERDCRITYRAGPGLEAVDLSFNDMLVRGIDQAERVSAAVIAEVDVLAAETGKAIGAERDFRELQSAQDASAATEIARLSDELDQMRARYEEMAFVANKAVSRFSERQRLVEVIEASLTQRQQQARAWDGAKTPAPHAAPAMASGFEFNALRDTRYAHHMPEFDGVAHVFHAEWVGIRAAVGSLHGDKFAIPAHAPISRQQLADITNRLADSRYRRIIFHGYSDRAGAIISALSATGKSEALFVVQHGNSAQWCYEGERRAAFEVMELAASGRVRKVHFMKAGFESGLPNAFSPMLFNLSPRLGLAPELPAPHGDCDGVVFAPAWSDWRKNLYTGVFAACLSAAVNKVLVYAEGLELPGSLPDKLVRHRFIDREQTFELLRASTLCLNASIVDCHPMVNVEAQTLGKACVRGPLHLDALEDHPYVRLTEVDAVMSIAATRAVIERVLAMPADELRALTLDYQAASDRIARERYLEFLEI